MNDLTLSQAIRKHRKERKLSREKLAELAGVGLNTVIGLESPRSRGRKSAGAQVTTLFRLADAMNISIAELLDGVGSVS